MTVGDGAACSDKSKPKGSRYPYAATYEGKPCAYGHNGVRYRSTGACVTCVRKKDAARRGDVDAAGVDTEPELKRSNLWDLGRVLAAVGLSRSEVYRLMREAKFPQSHRPFAQLPHRAFWKISEVQRWQAAEIQTSSPTVDDVISAKRNNPTVAPFPVEELAPTNRAMTHLELIRFGPEFWTEEQVVKVSGLTRGLPYIYAAHDKFPDSWRCDGFPVWIAGEVRRWRSLQRDDPLSIEMEDIRWNAASKNLMELMLVSRMHWDFPQVLTRAPRKPARDVASDANEVEPDLPPPAPTTQIVTVAHLASERVNPLTVPFAGKCPAGHAKASRYVRNSACVVCVRLDDFDQSKTQLPPLEQQYLRVEGIRSDRRVYTYRGMICRRGHPKGERYSQTRACIECVQERDPWKRGAS